jgi:AhpD family alkylhydroperoxidase
MIKKRPTEPRVPPVDPESLTESQRAIAGITVSNVMRTLVRHEALLMPWLTLAGTLGTSGRLAPRDRELVVLRVALRTDCAYEWAHAPLALGVGVTEAEIQALSNPSAPWSDAQAALLHAVDEVCADDCVSDETWCATDSATGARTAQQTGSRVDGTWQIVFFHHPAGDQNLTLVIDTSKGGISGSVTNPAVGITIPIVEGSVGGNRFSFKAPMTKPVQMEIGYTAVVDGEAISGEITIQGGGTFPFDGTRV